MPSRFPWNRNKQHITAASGDIAHGKSPTPSDVIAKRKERWQENVLELISSVPEASGASALIHNTLDRVELYVEAEGVSKSDIADLNLLLSGFDLGRAGMLIWQVGEAWIAWKQEGDQIVWEVNSPIEFLAETGRIPKQLNSQGKFIELSSDVEYFRIWKPDPAIKYNAWSPHKSMIDLLNAMRVHQLADTAVATSRLAGAGILYWPTDLPSIDPKGGRPEEGTREKLQEELQKAMLQSISDRNSSDAVVPLIVFGDPSLGGDFKPEHILLERPDDAKSFASRMEAYSERYARGVELPIESVQGMGPANHWTAWVIKEDKWRFYISPIADIPVKALTKNFIRPTLRNMGYSEEVIRNAEVIADGSALIEKPDKSDKAIRLAQLGGYLNQDAVIREAGFDPEKDRANGTEPQDQSNPRLQELPANFRDTSPMG